MNYISTRGNCAAVSSAQAVVNGLAPDGGLYTMAPDAIPQFELSALAGLDYYALAGKIVSALLPDFSEGEALELVRKAYSGKFASEELAPVFDTGKDMFLELFHGPTAAFKDMALCLLPYLMKESAVKCGSDDDILILTATSGDTGKAAMEGFRMLMASASSCSIRRRASPPCRSSRWSLRRAKTSRSAPCAATSTMPRTG